MSHQADCDCSILCSESDLSRKDQSTSQQGPPAPTPAGAALNLVNLPDYRYDGNNVTLENSMSSDLQYYPITLPGARLYPPDVAIRQLDLVKSRVTILLKNASVTALRQLIGNTIKGVTIEELYGQIFVYALLASCQFLYELSL
jgi:hypothetical protein